LGVRIGKNRFGKTGDAGIGFGQFSETLETNLIKGITVNEGCFTRIKD
jgi:hypothetical protein